jgi:serine-type D-Ala-D-Ala endopeptidase (penicillin-binding protein 7)
VGTGRRVVASVLALFAAIALALPADAASRRDKAREARSAKADAPARSSKAVAKRRAKAVAPRIARAPARPSVGQVYGLHGVDDALALRSSVALVVDQDTNEVLFSKNPQAVLPIASLSKLMTALVVTEAGLSLDETLTISEEDVDTEKGSHSRLRVGTQLTRGQMLHLALMSSENRAAHALGRTWPGGLGSFVVAMNRKARELGMLDTFFVEPTGLSPKNQSSARDLAVLAKAAHEHQIIRELSTSPEQMVDVGRRSMQFRTTNALVRSPEWQIGLQKTGYISEAGRCLVMQAELAGRQLIMVFLDSAGKYSRLGDAERVRRWVTQAIGPRKEAPGAVTPTAAPGTVGAAAAATAAAGASVAPAIMATAVAAGVGPAAALLAEPVATTTAAAADADEPAAH